MPNVDITKVTHGRVKVLAAQRGEKIKDFVEYSLILRMDRPLKNVVAKKKKRAKTIYH